MAIKRIVYTAPAPQDINMTYNLNKSAPQEEVFADAVGLIVRTSGNKAKGVAWGAVVHALEQVLSASPEMRVDLQAALARATPTSTPTPEPG